MFKSDTPGIVLIETCVCHNYLLLLASVNIQQTCRDTHERMLLNGKVFVKTMQFLT